AKGRLTDSIFNEMLEFFQNVFPIRKGFKLPPSYYAIKKAFKTIGLGYESIHACEHDCCLSRGDNNKDLDFCPVCNTSRWKDSNTPGKKVPKKVLRYFSIIPRLQRLYKSSHTAKEMIWHATGKCTGPGVKLPDGFGSCFKHKVTDNDTNIMGLKSHDCHIMMQRLLPYGLQNYLPDKIAKPIIDLCSLFKQICSATLMEDDMLKAQIKVVDILCELELIYPPALFDIMVHLVIHLPIEALEGGPIRPRWMYPFERYMKKLKGYVRNKAKPEGSIAEGYVAEEALTFSSHYFRDVTTKFNRPVHNVDPPPQTCQLQVFRSVCKSIGLQSVIRFDAQELKKVKWYVLYNSPEIDTYWSQFKSLFPNKDMKEEFPEWFGSQIRQRHVDNDKDLEVSTTSELFALACGPTWTPISINSCVVDGVRYVVHSRDERRTTQNSGICSPGPDGEMYYGQLQEILEFKYLLFKVVLFRDDPDIIHFDNSSDLPLSTSLNDLNNATLHIDGQSTVVDAPPDIIDVPDEDDDIIGDEDALPYDLMSSADVARSHGGDGGGDDRPPSHVVPTGCGGCFANKGKGKRKPNLGGRGAGRLNTRDKTQNLSLKEIAVAKGPVPINFEQGDKQTLNPLGPHAANWSNYIGEVVRSVPLYYPSWEKVPKERKAAIISEIGTLFDLRPHMDSSRWTEIYEGINQHLQKAYNTNKASFKAKHWKADPTTGTYDVEAIRRARPEEITAAEWDKYIQFWNDPKNLARAAQNRLNRQKSVVISRQGSRSLARLRDEMFHLICVCMYRGRPQTLKVPFTHMTPSANTPLLNGFPKDKTVAIREMKSLSYGVSTSEDESMRCARGVKRSWAHSPVVGRVLPSAWPPQA
ncbi:hypothetical protein Tco_0231950, partial [Tanacetum coccineum]